MDMVEKVARALRDSREYRERTEASERGEAVTDEIYWNMPPRETDIEDARAAIEAVRSPTEAMLTAAYPIRSNPYSESIAANHRVEFDRRWRDAFDTVLEE